MKHSFVQRGGWWVVGQFVLMLMLVAAGLRLPSTFSLRPAVLVGAGLMIAGAILALAGTLSLGKRLSPFPKPDARSELVQRGAYALMRHPLYTSLILAGFGWALFCQSGPGLVMALVMAVFLDAKARREERWLREHFQEYAQYQRRVRRFIPGIY
ncbi:MAG: isoprenylcysteine carboxylmethyltransferase family protein [Verrucomicrobiia bacterium]